MLASEELHVTVVADTNAVVYKLKKGVLTPLLKSNPEVARKMCMIVTRRRDEDQAMLVAESHPEGNESFFERIWDRMRKFHDLGE